MKKRKVSFRVRRIYYDQFADGTKYKELRALKPYWIKRLCPIIPGHLLNHPFIRQFLYEDEDGYIRPFICNPKEQPEIAVIHSPGQSTLYFEIRSIYVDRPECVLHRELSEQGKKDIPTELCIVTKLGERIE